MLKLELLHNARWDELYQFFMNGEPPIILRLLLLNTAFMMFMLIRKARNRYPNHPAASISIQAMLIAANFAVMFQPQLMPNLAVLG